MQKISDTLIEKFFWSCSAIVSLGIFMLCLGIARNLGEPVKASTIFGGWMIVICLATSLIVLMTIILFKEVDKIED